ncbi:choice-of-anchor D domain-containing protein [Ichthyenterobacterium sp. W332]|uniref:Choice-of-anchor D domain-containing protein n=1 Tax=Microcosmobacter mediterraneus TaxID=3075607 RepID=A0ABU2YKW9_9FLAO|nr:choice-of-anchor D domain-containing protein [Ichthyenterobacterium sp. W332]MDT0557890.1 choice-of-anchor D domain-containing protein [Ichthyenterobacterium sp. W332]
MLKKYSLSLLLFLCAFTFGFGQSVGDIAFLQFNGDGGGQDFKFITFIDIPAGTQINFTDRGWLSSGGLRNSSEGVMTWTSPGVNCGDVITLTEPGTAFALSTSGDQIIAFTGTTGSPTPIAAIHMNGNWDTDATSTAESAIPTGLTNGVNCLAIAPEVDNAIYNGTLTGTIASLRSAINNSANWLTNNSTQQTFTGTFNVTDCGGSTDTRVQFVSSTLSLAEDGLFIDVCASITNPSSSAATTVQVQLDGASTATNGTDYDDGAGSPAAIVFPQTLTFPANSSADQCITLYISNDDAVQEPDETVILNLINPSGGTNADLGSATQHVLTITDNDLNDDCGTAIPLAVNSSCINISASNVGASDSGLSDPGCANYNGADVWFSAVVPAGGEITVTTSDNGGIDDTGMALYSGANCGSLSLITCNDDIDFSGGNSMSEINESGLTVGSTVYIRVWEYDGNATGTFDICVTSPVSCSEPLAQPTNLVLSNVTASSIDGSFTASGSADNYLIIASTSNTLSGNPVDATSYNVGDSLGGGTVVAVGNSTSFTATGLAGNTTYYFFVFAFNDTNCGGGPDYLIGGPLTGNDTTLIGPCLGEESFESGFPSGWLSTATINTNAGNARTGVDYANFNDTSDWLELPPVDNPTSLQYYARLSSDPGSDPDPNILSIQYFDGTNWIELDAHQATTNTYQLFTTDLSGISVLTNVRLRLERTFDDRSHYVDDLSVFCGPTVTSPELQLIESSSSAYRPCGYSYDFGTVSTSQTGTYNLEIENLGNQDLTISSIGITGDFSIAPSTGITIPVGSSQTYTITFSPSSAGALSGILTINSNDSDEASCTINLNGTGFVGTPEIRLETSNNANIPDNLTTFAPVYDNTFAQQIEGDVSQPKTYFIVNLGDGDLDINSITLSSTEFTLVSNPAEFGTYTLAPDGIVPIEISFSPGSPGLKIATVTINNNDSDENPYNFDIRGTGICAGATIALSPSSGPIGTIVTVTGANFGGGSTFATINGEVAPFTVLSPTTMEVTIPTGADTAFLYIEDSSGCLAREVFTVYTEEDDTCDGTTSTIPAGWTDLLISGLFDNTGGSCHYLELFNPTAATIDLSTYSIRLSNNKASANFIDTNNGDFDYTSAALSLSGSVDAYSTFMVQFGNTGSTCSDCPNIIPDIVLTNGAFGVNGIGSDGVDRLVLINNGTEVDLWANSEYGSSGFVYTRDITSTAPKFPNIIEDTSTAITDYIVDSDGFDINDWDSQGTADCFGFSVPPFFDVPSVAGPTVSSPSCNIATLTVVASEGYDISGDTRDLDYDWYVFDPASGPNPTWQLISDGGIYSGADTDILTITDASNVLNYQFYCRVKENDATCYNASNAVSVTLPTTTWNGSWSPTLPDSDTVAIINANYNTTAGGQQTSFEACNLIINNGATLTIGDVNNGGANTYVEVQNNLYVYGSGAIIVQPQAAFVQINDSGTVTADNPDNIQVNKRTAPMDIATEYTYWSSPVEDETIGDALADANPGRRFRFFAQDFRDSRDETGNTNSSNVGHDDLDDNGLDDYVNDGTLRDWQLVNGSDTMLAGVGYASTHSPPLFNSFPCDGGPDCQFDYSFNGRFNNGIIPVSIFKNDEEMGDNNWNFVGNPYPSAIDADEFLDYNSDIAGAPNRVMTGAIYLWSQDTPADANTGGFENLNFSSSDYAIINGVGQTGTADGGDPTIPNRFIPSGQGFFIAMSNAALNTSVHTDPTGQPGIIETADLIFNNSMRVRGTSNNSQFFRMVNTEVTTNRETGNTEKLWLNLMTDNGAFSQVLVGYKEGATDDFDGAYFDAERNTATGAFAVLYSTIEDLNKKFAIQGKDLNSIHLDEVIPLGLLTSIDQATLYTVSIAELEGDFMLNNTIYIKDNLLNVLHNLSADDYTFTSEVGEFNDRFEIVFNADALSVNENELNTSELIITELQNGNVQFLVPTNFEMKSVEIIDLLGRSIYRFKANNHTEIYDLSALSSSTYIAKVTLSSGQIINKKAIKQK